MKRYKPLKLAFLILPLVWGFACSSPSTTSNRPDLFGNVDQSLRNGDDPIVYFEPPEVEGGSDVEINDPETDPDGGDVVADPAPEIPDSDEPKIVLYVSNTALEQFKKVTGSFLPKGSYNFETGEYKELDFASEDKEKNIDEDQDEFEITLGKYELIAKIKGEENYSLEKSEDPQSLIQDIEKIEKNRYRLVPSGQILSGEITLLAEDNSGDETEKTFELHIYDNPCDQPLAIQPVAIFKDDGTSHDLSVNGKIKEVKNKFGIPPLEKKWKTSVELGSKYHIVFGAIGEGPFDWSFTSEVKANQETDCIPGLTCHKMLESNKNWKEIKPGEEGWIGGEVSKEDLEKRTYFQLSTKFVFPDEDIPFNTQMANNKVWDELTVTASTSACLLEKGNSLKAEYILQHVFILPAEGVGNIMCKQQIQDVWDAQEKSQMQLRFKIGETEGARIQYYVRPCIDDESQCERPAGIANPSQFGSPPLVYEINKLEIWFIDRLEFDSLCYDCDYDQLDYDLISLQCYTDYLEFLYWDEDKPIDEKCAGPFDCHYEDLNDDVMHEPINFAGWDYISYDITRFLPSGRYGIWKPRYRPNYPSD